MQIGRETGLSRRDLLSLVGTVAGSAASGHNGCIATEVILQATTGRIHDRTQRFADSQIPLAPRAPSIHDPLRKRSVHRSSRDNARRAPRSGVRLAAPRDLFAG